jgi:hypothetical protein
MENFKGIIINVDINRNAKLIILSFKDAVPRRILFSKPLRIDDIEDEDDFIMAGTNDKQYDITILPIPEIIANITAILILAITHIIKNRGIIINS